MTCHACGHDNRISAKFCEACGARLSHRCSACGTDLRAAARFCDECGHPVTATAQTAPEPAPTSVDRVAVAARLTAKLPGYTPRHLAEKILTARSAIEGERKQVTVLFADCAGFTALSRTLDPEALHHLMDGCFELLVAGIHRFEGTVNQFTGDGVMALFGAPIAHEDHAVRAVAAALDVQTRLAAYAERLRREQGLEFAVRIGINTGPVVVGKIGDDLRMDYTAQGETVNLAARLQALASPGGVLVSEATHRLVAGFFSSRDDGERLVKGYDDPVRVFVVTGQLRRRGRFDLAVERGLTPLAGRTQELAMLRDSFERVKAGQGRVVSVVGDAGTGKSRLVYELRRTLESETVTYLEGRATPHTAEVPFHLVVELLEDAFGIREEDDEAARVERVERRLRTLDPALEWTLPYLKHLLGLGADDLAEAGLDQVQQKRRLADAVRAYVLRAAQHTPLVVACEDLQWIDPNSEELLRLLADASPRRSLLMIGTYRAGYAPPWHDHTFHQRLVLEALTTDEARRMAHSLAPTADAARIVERAAGNPFFIEELTRYVRERSDATELPETVQDLLTARIDRLPERLKRLLQVAAVLGREFRLSLLAALVPETDVEPAVAELVSRELLREKDVVPEPLLAFSHPLVQEVAYGGLLVKSRTELHGRAGEALERLHAGRLDDVVDQLADHFVHSADRERAVRYLTLAGDRAARLFAYREAQTAYTRALDRVSPDATGVRATLLDKLGDVTFGHGSLTQAQAAWDEALGLVTARGERDRMADLHRKIAGSFWAGGHTEPALAHLQAGLTALGEATDNLAAARLDNELARIHFRLGQHKEAMEWARRALALGQSLDAADVVSHAYNTLGVAVSRDGDLEAGATFVTQSLETALAHQLGAAACRAYINLAAMYASLDHHRSEQYCRDGLALATRIGDRMQEAWLHCVLAGGHCTIAGDYDEGVRAAEAAVELDERLGLQNHLPVPLIILAQIHQCRGDQERSEGYYRRALEVAEAVGEPQLLVPCYEGLATLAIERDSETEAEAWLAKSRDVQQTTGWTSDTFLVLPFLA